MTQSIVQRHMADIVKPGNTALARKLRQIGVNGLGIIGGLDLVHQYLEMPARIAKADLLDQRIGFGDGRSGRCGNNNGFLRSQAKRRKTEWMIYRCVDQDDVGRVFHAA